ncbi:hypothetical protein GQ42DRAFT_151975 [Ramicandelaber brevisporus]|nr:hypothetical protein GQ42DRAFT_151975 [Ramicandelaber brevisporus]
MASAGGYDSLLQWMAARGFSAEHTPLQPHTFADTGRGMAAARAIQPGEPLIRLPKRVVITRSLAAQSVPECTLPGLSEHQALALLLLVERARGAASGYADYIATIPPAFDGMPAVAAVGSGGTEWLDGIAAVIPRELDGMVRRQLFEIARGCEAAKSIISSSTALAALPDLASLDIEQYGWAWAAVNSRCISVVNKPAGPSRSRSRPAAASTPRATMALAPYLDLLNHSSTVTTSNAVHPDGAVSFLATRHYAAGDQVFIQYHPKPSSYILAEYGFVEPGNPHEVVDLGGEVGELVQAAAGDGTVTTSNAVHPDGAVSFLATRHYAAGEQVFIQYHPKPSPYILAEYGFVEPGNPHEVVDLGGEVSELVQAATRDGWNAAEWLRDYGIASATDDMVAEADGSLSFPLLVALPPLLRLQCATTSRPEKQQFLEQWSRIVSSGRVEDHIPAHNDAIRSWLQSVVAARQAAARDAQQLLDDESYRAQKRLSQSLAHSLRLIWEQQITILNKAADALNAPDQQLGMCPVASNASLLWGTYRPGLYLGTRPRTPATLATGLMWVDLRGYNGLRNVRHTCDMGDKLSSYGFLMHDGRTHGAQEIVDTTNNVRLTTQFLKPLLAGEQGAEFLKQQCSINATMDDEELAHAAGTWVVRVTGEHINKKRPAALSLVYYLALEGIGRIDLDMPYAIKNLSTPIGAVGTVDRLGQFRFTVRNHPRNKPAPSFFKSESERIEAGIESINRVRYMGSSAPHGKTWKAADIFAEEQFAQARSTLQKHQKQFKPADIIGLDGSIAQESNVLFFQQNLEPPFAVDFIFETTSSDSVFPKQQSSANERAKKAREAIKSRIAADENDVKPIKDGYAKPLSHLSGAKGPLGRSALDSTFVKAGQSFEDRFMRVFNLTDKNVTSDEIHVAKAAMSGVIGGIGSFYGDQIIASDINDDEDDSKFQSLIDAGSTSDTYRTLPQSLFSAVPSRPFFPRGFLWDEGYHQLIIGAWDNDLSIEILKSWYNLMDEDGWIPRELILGDEARNKVPEEFRTQFPNYANPPTLAMALQTYIDRLKNKREARAANNGTDESSTGFESLRTAMLDDDAQAEEFLRWIYPRLRRQMQWFRHTQYGEVRRWGRAARSNEAFRWRGRTVNHTLTSGFDDFPRADPPSVAELHVDLHCWMAMLSRALGDVATLLGDEDASIEYSDLYSGIVDNLDALHWSEADRSYCDVTADDRSGHSRFVCHRGYVTLFPLIHRLIPPSSTRLRYLLSVIRDTKHLWSPYGLRSLSASDDLYGTDENYWRGPIWININYLVLAALHNHYAVVPGPMQKPAKIIYQQLRRNVIDNVIKQYKDTGFLWEQYSPATGKGMKAHPFTGWTSLIALIIAEKYP